MRPIASLARAVSRTWATQPRPRPFFAAPGAAAASAARAESRSWATRQSRPLSSAAAPATMKAVTIPRHGGVEVLTFGDVAKPVPAEGEVLVRNEFIGVNFIDTYWRSGLYQRTQFPTGLGEEGAGTVEAIGPGVTALRPGDRVGYVTRSQQAPSYAEFTAVSAELATLLPEGVGTQQAAAVLLQGLTALSMVKTTCRVEAGDWVLVHAAAGGTGQLLVQLCSHIGAKVIGTTSTAEKAEIARRCGCHDVILYTQEDVVERVRELTGGRGVKFVYDGVGKATFDSSLKVLDYLGWLISFGNASGKPEPFDVLRLGEKSARLMRPSLFSTLQADKRLAGDLTAELLGLVQQGVVTPEVHKVYALSDAAQAQDDLASRRTTGKLLLRP